MMKNVSKKIYIILIVILILGLLILLVYQKNANVYENIGTDYLYKSVDEKTVLRFIDNEEGARELAKIVSENDKYAELNSNVLGYAYISENSNHDYLIILKKKTVHDNFYGYEGKLIWGARNYSTMNFIIDNKKKIILSIDDNNYIKFLETKCGYYFNDKGNIYTKDMKYIGFYNENEKLQEDNDGIYLYDAPLDFCYCPADVVCYPCVPKTYYPVVKFNCNGEKID